MGEEATCSECSPYSVACCENTDYEDDWDETEEEEEEFVEAEEEYLPPPPPNFGDFGLRAEEPDEMERRERIANQINQHELNLRESAASADEDEVEFLEW